MRRSARCFTPLLLTGLSLPIGAFAASDREYANAIVAIKGCRDLSDERKSIDCRNSARFTNAIDTVLKIQGFGAKIKKDKLKDADAGRLGYKTVEAFDLIMHPETYINKPIELRDLYCMKDYPTYICASSNFNASIRTKHISPSDTLTKIESRCDTLVKVRSNDCLADARLSFSSYEITPPTSREVKIAESEQNAKVETARARLRLLRSELNLDLVGLAPFQRGLMEINNDFIMDLAIARQKASFKNEPTPTMGARILIVTEQIELVLSRQ